MFNPFSTLSTACGLCVSLPPQYPGVQHGSPSGGKEDQPHGSQTRHRQGHTLHILCEKYVLTCLKMMILYVIAWCRTLQLQYGTRHALKFSHTHTHTHARTHTHIHTHTCIHTIAEGNTCFYGNCTYCHRGRSVCAKGEILEGSVALWLPDWYELRALWHPWWRAHQHGVREKLSQLAEILQAWMCVLACSKIFIKLQVASARFTSYGNPECTIEVVKLNT